MTSKRQRSIDSLSGIFAFRIAIRICWSGVSTPSRSGKSKPRRPLFSTMTPYFFTSKSSILKILSGVPKMSTLYSIFSDIAGIANQKIATSAEKVFFTVAGLVVDLKNLSENL